MDDTILNFNMPTNPLKIIKAIGVGGGGGNAVSNMQKEGINAVSFVLCNTDSQALSKSDVPNKLLIGTNTTGGLGAGNRPEKGEAAALESEEDIRKMLNDGTRMAFITAGMGGGTGTGAAPVIARISKSMGILTVGIVTIPYVFEGRPKIVKALQGVRRMAENVDSLVVVNNQALMGLNTLSVPQANRKADETLTIAARSISEIITTNLEQNVDFADIDTTMRDSGVALVSVGIGEGEGRLRSAINQALESTLANDKDQIYNAQRVAFVIYYSHEDELKISEMEDVNDFMSKFNTEYEVKWGHGYDDSLGHQIKITILATGFGLEDVLSNEVIGTESEEELIERARKTEEMKRRREEEDAWIGRYYGSSVNTKSLYKMSAQSIAVLTQRELDDDAFISLLEENPTYNRDPKLITRARSKNGGELLENATPRVNTAKQQVSRKNNPGSSNSGKGGMIISFT